MNHAMLSLFGSLSSKGIVLFTFALAISFAFAFALALARVRQTENIAKSGRKTCKDAATYGYIHVRLMNGFVSIRRCLCPQ